MSTLTHFAVNVVAEGTPVAAAGLRELGVDPREFAERLLERVVAEERGIANARVKVRARGEA